MQGHHYQRDRERKEPFQHGFTLPGFTINCAASRLVEETMIELYTWSTPNGRKVSVMLGGMRSRVQAPQNQHRSGRAIRSGLPCDQSQRQDSLDRRSERARREAHADDG